MKKHTSRSIPILLVLFALVLGSCAAPAAPLAPTTAWTEIPVSVSASVTEIPHATALATVAAPVRDLGDVIPMPSSVQPGEGAFVLTAQAQILVDPAVEEIKGIGEYLASILRPATGYALEVVSSQGSHAKGNIVLSTTGTDSSLGEEGYQLEITPEVVRVSAYRPTGLFHGVQTLRQLFPAQIEANTVQSVPWDLPAGTIQDVPRFAWRGTMLDVARHFFSPSEIKPYIDLLAYYKLNVLHLHLADDQGWRIQINSWPRLAEYGGSKEVGGSKGGYFTQEQYRELVAYAQSRYITIIPEIDMPGHTNAALASYAELNCSGTAPGLYTGYEVGFSSLCTDKEITYQFLEDVIRELAALTPGPYIHMGGDESNATDPSEYVKFVEQVQSIVQENGKAIIGWEDISQAKLAPDAVIQSWNIDPQRGELAARAAQQGMKVILSPANKTYLDMKYNASTSLGLTWAGLISVQDAYTWDPASVVPGLSEENILGIEAPLWSETLEDLQDIEYMAFPRLIGYAELGWSLDAGKDWNEYKTRLAEQGPRLEALEVNYYKSPDIDWK